MSSRSTFRILHCLRAPVGGLFRHVCDLAAAQQSAGHEVAVVCAATGDALTEARLAELGARISLGVHRIASSRNVGFADVGGARRVRRLAAELDVDILHGHGAKGGAYARLAAGSLRKPRAIYTPHGGSLHYSRDTLSGRAVLSLERALERATHGIIFESAYSAAQYAARVGPPRVNQCIVPNGLQPGEFEPVSLSADATDLLFVGELRHLKGVDVLLDAVAFLNKSRPTSATIVGSGPDAAQFKAQADRLGLSSSVRFPGAMPVSQAFKMGRVMVMPSRAESFPYIVLEAAAAARPLIVTNVGGIPEITGGVGWPLVAPGRVDALAGALAGALDDEAKARGHALALQQRVKALFTVAGMADGVLRAYDSVCVPRAAAVSANDLVKVGS